MAATSPSPNEYTKPHGHRLALTFALAALLLGSLLSGGVHALESDAQQPIEVEADSTEFDNQTQRHTLYGDVEVRQGTMKITGDRITLQLANGKLVELNAQGTPLTFQVQDDIGTVVRAEANQIIYKPGDAILALLGDARLLSDGRELSGERIDYDIAKANVQALSGDTTRVRVTIDPTVQPSGN